MELPINQLRLKSHKRIIPDLSKKDFYALKKSIEKWGIIEPIVINQNNVIICGKERYRAALVLGMKKVPVVIKKTTGKEEIKEVMRGKERRRKKRKYTHLRKAIIKQLGISKQQVSRYQTSTKLIPELSELLDEGKINKESASVYAKVSFENQKRIYGILMNNFSNDKSEKMKG